MILGNIDQASFNPYRKLGHFSVQKNYRPSTWYSMYLRDTTTTSNFNTASVPTGTEPPYSWLLAIKGGELSSTTYLSGEGTLSGSFLLGKTMTADLAGSSDLVGSLSVITSLLADLAGSGTLSGDASLAISMAADLIGAGDISGALNLLIPLDASLTSMGTIIANLKGSADLAATIYVNQSEATVQDLVAGVWNALAADYNSSGTMGEKMNAAGTAGDPWTTDLSAYNTNGTAGKIVKQIKSIGQANL